MAYIKVGGKAPDFTLQSNKGESVTLSEFFGKKNVVLFFYPMDESPVCAREARAFRNAYKIFNQLEAEVLGVSSQDVQSHRTFASHCNLPFILLSDPDSKVRKLYNACTTLGAFPKRVTFVIGKDGFVKHVFSSQFRPSRHADEAVRALKTLV